MKKLNNSHHCRNANSSTEGRTAIACDDGFVFDMGKSSFIIHKDSLKLLDRLSVIQAGEFILAVKSYHENGSYPEEFWLQMAIEPFINQWNRDIEKYESIVERNRANGQLGGRPKNDEITQITQITQWDKKNPSEPKKADNDNDNDREKDKYSFGHFWNVYGKKVGKRETEAYWSKMREADRVAAVDGTDNYKAGREAKYMQDPIRYLRNKRWEDEPLTPIRKPANPKIEDNPW